MEVIVDTLCNNMIGDKEQLRDISSIGLKTVINELPLTTQTLAATVCKTIVGRLSSAISQQEDVGVQLEALDILGKKIICKNCCYFCPFSFHFMNFHKYLIILEVGVQLEALDILGKIVFKNCRNYRLYFVRVIHSVIN